MKDLKLKVSARSTGKKGRAELPQTSVPGVVYGREFESTAIAADLVTLTKMYNEAGSNHIVSLDIDGKNQDTVFKDIQFDPVTSDIRHFDLYAIKKGEKIKAEVPVVAIGDSPGVIKGGQLSVNLEEVEIECIPSKLPDHFDLDISVLTEIGDSLYVSDIKVDDEEIVILTDPETNVFKIDEIREMVVEDESAPAEEEIQGEEGEEGEDGSPSEEPSDEENQQA